MCSLAESSAAPPSTSTETQSAKVEAASPTMHDSKPSLAVTEVSDGPQDDDRSIDTFASLSQDDLENSATAPNGTDGGQDAQNNKEASSASLGISDIEIMDIEEGQPNRKPSTSANDSNRRNSSLRSSLLRKGRRNSQESLRWSKQISDTILDDLDLESDNEVDGASKKLSSGISSNLSKEEASPGAKSEPATPKKTVKTVTTQNSQVFFMIGCQRSGSNWLRTMLSEREDLIAPHPPHIMRDFMPRLKKYGDLSVQQNLKVLIDHVCAFTERNQVKWLDLHSRATEFKRSAILMEVMVTIECYRFKEKYTAMQEGRDVVDKVDNPYYLLATFDAIMNTMTKANGKKIWMCKSMGMSQFHHLLLSFYGKERLRYIYLVRDPRDVCLSFMNTPVGDCHPYSIAKKWARLQNYAATILHVNPELLHEVCYEKVLANKKSEVAKVIEFMGARDVCRSMRRGSIIAIKNENEVVSGAKNGREAMSARRLSYQFKNLVRGDSFLAGQFKKWTREMCHEDMLIVESVAWDEMQRLGYEPHLVKTEEDRINFSDTLCEEYTAENSRLIDKMNADLAIKNPADLHRRKVQAAVLERKTSEHYDEEFVKSFCIDIDNALESIDNVQSDKGFLQKKATAKFDFHQWPLNASMVGFMPGIEVSKRFEVEETKMLKLKGGLSIRFAAASQGGYYPNERTKKNQDAFIAGARVTEATSRSRWKKEKDSGILFAVFDGHGPNGTECAQRAKEHVLEQFVEDMKNDTESVHDQSDHISSSMKLAYRRTSAMLEMGAAGIDASHSGTTAVSLFIANDSLHTANVGDSRCLLIEQDRQGNQSIHALTVDHTPDREDEIKRIEAHGGVVMSSEQYDMNDAAFTSFEQKRIWSNKGKWPGTAFTRSIGDAIAKELGVCADPECANHPIVSDSIFVMGSDGVFDFIPPEEIKDIVQKYNDPADACKELVGKAWNRWCDSEERADDITVIVGHIRRPRPTLLAKLGRRFPRKA